MPSVTKKNASYSEWLSSVDVALVDAGIKDGISNVSKVWLRVQYSEGSAPFNVVYAVKRERAQ